MNDSKIIIVESENREESIINVVYISNDSYYYFES